MKFKIFIFILFISIVGCQNSEDNGLVGTWEIIEFRLEITGGGDIKQENDLIKEGAVWDITFLKNGDFTQEFNMSNPDKIKKTESGTWNIENDILTVILKNNSQEVKMNYNFKIKGKELELFLGPAGSTDKIISRFRKK